MSCDPKSGCPQGVAVTVRYPLLVRREAKLDPLLQHSELEASQFRARIGSEHIRQHAKRARAQTLNHPHQLSPPSSTEVRRATPMAGHMTPRYTHPFWPHILGTVIGASLAQIVSTLPQVDMVDYRLLRPGRSAQIVIRRLSRPDAKQARSCEALIRTSATGLSCGR